MFQQKKKTCFSKIHQNRQNTVSTPASNYYEIVCNEIHVRASKCK